MDVEKVRRLLENIRRISKLKNWGCKRMAFDIIAQSSDQALSALDEEPENKGQSLKRFRLDVLQMGWHNFAGWLGVKPSHICNVEHGRKFDEPLKIDEKPCQQPPASEGMEQKVEARLYRPKGLWRVDLAETIYGATKKEAEGRAACKLHSYHNCDAQQQQIEKRDEAIRYLYYKYCDVTGAVPQKYGGAVKIELKRILGDEEFEELTDEQ